MAGDGVKPDDPTRNGRPPGRPASARPPARDASALGSIDAADDRFGADVVRMGPATRPHIEHQIERVVAYVNLGCLSVRNREDHGLDRRALAAGGLQAEYLRGVLPVQVEGDESTSVPAAVE